MVELQGTIKLPEEILWPAKARPPETSPGRAVCIEFLFDFDAHGAGGAFDDLHGALNVIGI